MTTVSMIACTVAVWSILRGRFGSVVLDWAARYKPSPRFALTALAALVPAQLAQIVLLWLQVRFENGPPSSDWLQRLPLPVYDHHSFSLSLHPTFAALGFLLGATEAGMLAVVALATERGAPGPGKRAVAVVAALLAVVAIASPVMSTTDPYEYVAAGMVGLGAYAPPHGFFAHTVYAPIYPHVPMDGVLYGPLWLIIDVATTYLIPTIVGKLIALRIVNALLIWAFLVLLRRAGLSPTVRVAVAVNPALWFYLVVNAHVEIECLIAVVAAYIFAQRSRAFAALLLVVAAGMIKIPFIVAGAAAFVPFASMRARLALWVGASGLVVGLSYLFPGPIYLTGVEHHASSLAARAHVRGAFEYITIIPLVCALMAALVAFKRGAPGAAWLFGQLSPLTAPWYLLWGMPYALATASLVVFLVPLPLLTAMRDLAFIGSPIPLYLVVALVTLVALDAYLTARRRFVSVAGP